MATSSAPVTHPYLEALAAHYEGTGILGRWSLRFYQNWLVSQIKEKPFLYLAVDMGLGKTIAVLTALQDMADDGDIEWPVLIVAPKLVCEETWPEEIRGWLHTKGLTYSVIAGNPNQRKRAARRKANIHLIGYENFQWLRELWGRRWPYKVLVCDEATRIKSGRKRTKPGRGLRQDGTPRVGRRTSRFGAIARVRNLLDRCILMSGTPAPQGLEDLWAPFYILDRGERLGKSKTAFVNRWFSRHYMFPSIITPHLHSHGEIMERVSDLMISLRAEDYIELPGLVPVEHWVTMPPKMMQRYKTFERTLYDEITDVEAVSAGVLVNKLLQFANGSLYVDADNAEHVHDLKLAPLESIYTEANGQPILLAYEFRFDLPRIMKRFPKARVVGDKNWKKDWDAGRIPMLITHPASAGHGLNLQFGGYIGVWFGLTSSLEYFLQFRRRLQRPGQKAEAVIMHYLLTRGTEDEAQFGRLTDKAATQDLITDAVRITAEDMHHG